MENPFKAIPQKRIKNIIFLFITFYNTTPGKKVQYVKGKSFFIFNFFFFPAFQLWSEVELSS